MSFPFSAGYFDAVTNGGQRTTRVDVLDSGGVVIASSTNMLLVTQGSVRATSTGPVRRTLSGLTLLDPDGSLIPTDGRALFSPLAGHELQIWSGYVINGAPELFCLGTFEIDTPTTDDIPAGRTITLNGVDRSKLITDNRYIKPYVVNTGQNVEAALVNIITDRLPQNLLGPIAITPSNLPITERLVFQSDSDPWQQAQALANDYGMEVGFGPRGTPFIRPIPDPMDPFAPIAWNYAEGPHCTMLAISRAQQTDDNPNGIIAMGTGSSFPPSATVWDDNPNSATYFQGPYGKRPKKITSARIKTDAQALAAAKGYLNKYLGAAEIVKWSVIPNPNHEPGDIVRIRRAASRLDDALFLDEFTCPLQASGAPTMDIVGRIRRIR